MTALGDLDVSYGQVSVFQSQLPNPFNNWRDAHVRQGFSWRSGSVGFRTLDDGQLSVEVERGTPSYREDAVRIIRVPFTVDASGQVEVATISDSRALSLKPGEYSLTFEHGRTPQGHMWCRFGVEPVEAPASPQIVRADRELSPEGALVMDAEAATP